MLCQDLHRQAEQASAVCRQADPEGARGGERQEEEEGLGQEENPSSRKPEEWGSGGEAYVSAPPQETRRNPGRQRLIQWRVGSGP